MFLISRKKKNRRVGGSGGVGQFPVQKNPKLRNSALLTVKTNKKKAFIQLQRERKEREDGRGMQGKEVEKATKIC